MTIRPQDWFVGKLFMLYVYIASGFVVTGLLVISCLVWPVSKTLYRKLSYYLAYSHWCHYRMIAHWWANLDMVIKLAEGTDPRLFGKEKAVVIMNHHYDIDWIVIVLLNIHCKTVEGFKIYLKDNLKYIPIVGWIWYFREFPFIKRNWEKDQKTINESLHQIANLPYSFWLMMACEGTRFTEERHQQSMEFAKNVGLPPLKHHLIPRTKGFVHAIYNLKGKVPAIYSAVLAFDTDYSNPTNINLYRGESFRAQLHIRRIPLDEVPTDSHENCAKWLHELYQEKDELFDLYERTGQFPGTPVIIKRQLSDTFVSIFWAVLTCLPLIYYVFAVFPDHSIWVQTTVVASAVSVFVSINVLMIVMQSNRSGDYKKKYKNKKL